MEKLAEHLIALGRKIDSVITVTVIYLYRFEEAVLA